MLWLSIEPGQQDTLIGKKRGILGRQMLRHDPGV